MTSHTAGGLAVFYNLDHLVTLLPPSVRVTGFPDAGFFMDAPNYVADFQGADPVWNVTGSGGAVLNTTSNLIYWVYSADRSHPSQCVAQAL